MPIAVCPKQKEMHALVINAYRRLYDLDIFRHTAQDLLFAKDHVFRMNRIVSAHCRECDECNGTVIIEPNFLAFPPRFQ